MKTTLLLNLFALLGVILLCSTAYAAGPFTVKPFEQPYAIVQHIASAHKVSIVNLSTQGISTIVPTNTNPIYDVQVDQGGRHAYLSFVGVNGIQLERWGLKNNQLQAASPPLLGGETNYKVALAGNDKHIVVTSYAAASNSWFAHIYDTTTFQLQNVVTLAGKGNVAFQVVSPNTEKVFVAVGNTTGALTEIIASTGSKRSLNSLLGNLTDATATSTGVATSHISVNSQMQSANFSVVNPSITVHPLPVATPPTIQADPKGNKIVFLSQNQQFKGGIYENGQIKCSFNTNVIYTPMVTLATNDNEAYTIVDLNTSIPSTALRKIDTDTCSNANVLTITPANYGTGKNRMALTPNQQFIAAIEGSKLHYWLLPTLSPTETVIDLGATATSVQTRMVRRITP